MNPLRKCLDCGLEANTEEELESFTKYKNHPSGRRNLCKKCDTLRAKRHRQFSRGSLVSRYNHFIKRCYDVNHPRYKDYGGRGIVVCEEWKNDREAFIEWAFLSGYKYNLTLDRENNDKGYSPENCRWVTQKEQNMNSRRNVTNFTERMRICEVCKINKSLTEFHRNVRLSEGRMYVCKDCSSAKLKEKNKHEKDLREKHLRETVDPFLPKLTCYVCGKTKTTRHFDRDHSKKIGFRLICKTCRRERRKLKRF